MRRLLALTIAFAALCAPAALAASSPHFSDPRTISIPGLENLSGAGDALGRLLLITTGRSGVTIVNRVPTRPWNTLTLPGFAPGPFIGRVSVAAAGDGAAAIALTQTDLPTGARAARVWVRNPGASQFESLPAPGLPASHEIFDPSVGVDASGRVITAFRAAPAAQDIRSPDAIAVAIREPGRQFGPLQLLTDPGAGTPVVVTSPGGRSVVTWQRNATIEAVGIEKGIVGQRVVLRRARSLSEPVAAIGPNGETVIGWTELTPGRRGHTTVMAAYRGRRGPFRRATVLARVKSLVCNSPAVAIDRRGNAVIAWGWRVLLRGNPGHRDGIDALVASAPVGRLSPVRHVDAATNVSQPSAASAGAGTILAWTVRERARGFRDVRAATVRGTAVGRPSTVGKLTGNSSELVLPLRRGPSAVSLVWPNRGIGIRPRIVGVDASGL